MHSSYLTASVAAAAACTRAWGLIACAQPPSDREAKLDALYADAPVYSSEGANTEEDSHLHLDFDEDGLPVKARFTYVDEHTCIGCTYCASIARNTFFMEEDHGRARVFDQAGDSDDLIMEAIDSCPVNCIHYVSYEDLVILETERAGQRINNAARLVSQQECTSDAPPTKARAFDSGAMRCNNCPGRGCKECPMFGVGENPVYLQRLAAREEKRRASGAAQAEAEQQRRAALIDSMYNGGGGDLEDAPPVADGDAGAGAGDDLPELALLDDEASASSLLAADDAAVDGLLDALYQAPDLLEYEEE